MYIQIIWIKKVDKLKRLQGRSKQKRQNQVKKRKAIQEYFDLNKS